MERAYAGLPRAGWGGNGGGMTLPRLFSAFLLLGLALVATGCASSKKKDYPIAVVRFMMESGGRESGGTVRLPRSGTTMMVAPKAEFSEYDIVRCSVVENELGKSLAFQLTPQAGRDLYRLSAMNQGLRIITVLNGRAIGARRIDGPLAQGHIVTYVEIDERELDELAKNITSTSLDAQKELEKKTG